MNNGDKPASPSEVKYHDGQRGVDVHEFNSGMSKREAFAMAAMQGLVAGDPAGKMSPRGIAENSVLLADALLAALENDND